MMCVCVCVCVCVTDNQLIHRSSEDGLLLLSPSDNTTEELISPLEWTELGQILGSPIENVILSHDRTIAMLVTNIEKVCYIND